MKKILIVLSIILVLGSCTYAPVDSSTNIPVSAQQYSLKLKDSVNGLYLFKFKDDKIGHNRDFIFKKDSTSIKLIEKYKTNEYSANISLLPLLIFVLILVMVSLALIDELS